MFQHSYITGKNKYLETIDFFFFKSKIHLGTNQYFVHLPFIYSLAFPKNKQTNFKL